ncbi:putative ribonuclease H-like domain-containing protein [Tanacetum coccineum]
MTHPSHKRNIVPKAVLMRFGLVSLTTARPVNTAQCKTIVNSARPMTNVFNKVHSTIKRPINNKTATKNSNFNHRVNTVSDKNVNTARLKAVVNTAKLKAVLNAIKRNQCITHSEKDQGVIDSGCSRHMTGNISYLTDFKEIDEGYVAFSGNPKGGKITGRATSDESKLWHRRLGHTNFKTMNKLVKGNLVRGLPSKLFENDQTYVTCQKGKQHRASCKSKIVSSISQPLHILHMDLFGPTVVKSLMKKMYCLVVTDDYSRFSYVFFLATKDETTCILKSFITRIEDLIDQRVKVIRCDNGTEFKNKEMNQFCKRKGIKREFSVARTPQQNEVAKRKNRTLIEATRAMLADSKCPVTIFNTIDHLGKFDGKADEGFFVGYSINSKAFRVFNSRIRIVEENLHVQFSTNAGKARMETVPGKDCIMLPLWPADPLLSQNSKSSPDSGIKSLGDNEKKVTEETGKEGGDSSNDQEKEDDNVNSTNNINTASDGNSTNNVNAVSSTVNAVGIEVNAVGVKTSIKLLDDPNMPELEDIVYSDDYEDVGAEADINNFNTFMTVSPIPTTRIHKDHPVEQIIRDLNLAPQTRRMAKNLKEHEAIQEELLQFKLQEVWTLVDLPNGKRPIGTKWVYRNKKDKRGIVIKNKARLMDIKSAFLYGKIEEEVYVYQPPGFEDLDFLDRVYKVEKALYGLHQAPRTWCETLLTYLLDNGFQKGKIDKTLFLRRDKGDILQDKYVTEILKKFGFTDVKTASTPMETQKPLLKDEDGEEVDILKGQPKLGLWYPKDSPFDLVPYTDCDYAGASLDRKSTIGGCQFLGCRLISWQCKKDSNEKKLIQMIKIHTDKNVADLLTKAFDAKTVNGKVQLQALVNGKKIVVTEASVRRDLQLEDADGVNCLPNAIIFEQLTLMGYENFHKS